VLDARLAVLDVFTANPLEGNQLAVCADASDIPERYLQSLAREIGFAETVYVYPAADDAHTARIRIFTPGSELPFAGHPVLGTAVLLARSLGDGPIVLETGNGPVRIDVSGTAGRIQMPLPTWSPYTGDAAALLGDIGIGASELPIEVYDVGIRHLYVLLPDEAAVAALAPDPGRLARSSYGAAVNCVAGRGTTWKTRMFFPAAGVLEDAATGSAAGPLAVHLARHGRIPFGQEITISQGVELSRPSTLYAVARGSADRLEAVEVAGDAVVVGSMSFAL
jgi:trans-2,3-dihydro-3-hydroxyanthranilate isomerase